MREIELKFKVDELDKFVKKIEELGCTVGSIITQNDTIYVANLDDTDSVEGSIWLRVRKVNNKIEMNYKKQSALKSESQEIEFGVDDYEKANRFLKALGYKEWVRVNKKRRYSKYKSANLCIDEVERLGSFVEIEYLIDENDKKINYEDELIKLAEELGIDIHNIVNSHYDTMIAELGD